MMRTKGGVTRNYVIPDFLYLCMIQMQIYKQQQKIKLDTTQKFKVKRCYMEKKTRYTTIFNMFPDITYSSSAQ